MKHGSGELQLPNGDHYEGYFEEDQYHRHGIYHYCQQGQEGVIICEIEYEGEWTKGQRSGQGQLKYSTGADFQGSFKNGHPHGMGILRIPMEEKARTVLTLAYYKPFFN